MARKTTKKAPARPKKTSEVDELKAQVAQLMAALQASQAPAAEVVPVIEPDEEAGGVRLDLGGGETPKEGYEAVDPFAPGAAHKVHLWDGQRWPFEDGSVDALHSCHTIEHIDAAWIDTYHGGAKMDALMFFFSEAFRILKPGGAFTLQWPAAQNVRAFMDPTHRRFIPREFLLYLDQPWRESQKLDHYLAQGRPLDFKVVSAQPTVSDADAVKAEPVQIQHANEHWNFFQDWIVTLNKPE